MNIIHFLIDYYIILLCYRKRAQRLKYWKPRQNWCTRICTSASTSPAMMRVYYCDYQTKSRMIFDRRFRQLKMIIDGLWVCVFKNIRFQDIIMYELLFEIHNILLCVVRISREIKKFDLSSFSNHRGSSYHDSTVYM